MAQQFKAPTAWGKEPITVLTGIDLTDKANLVGAPFLITEVWFTNQRNAYVWVDAIDINGDRFTFSDSSSTGIRKQIIDLVTDASDAGIVDTGAHKSMRIAVPRGLRVSEYDNPAGKGKAKTYYLNMERED